MNHIGEDPQSSWIQSIIPDGSDFTLHNLPWGVFVTEQHQRQPRICTRVGNHIVDVHAWLDRSIEEDDESLPDGVDRALRQASLNEFMELGSECWTAVRRMLTASLCQYNPLPRDSPSSDICLIPVEEVFMLLPVRIGDYTDFYCSKEHAVNVGTMFRSAANALNPNWDQMPIGYHGRASSIITAGNYAGVQVHRPWGQIVSSVASEAGTIFSPTRKMDFETELACVIGTGNVMGEPIHVDNAREHIFGYMLMNDLSARDIQQWEYVPLGPFNGKNFATVVSPWIVTAEALRQFVTAPPNQEPPPQQYLREKTRATFDITMFSSLTPAGCSQAQPVAMSMFKDVYWTFEQMIAHHTVGGCNLRPGDLLGSGTGDRAQGSLLELAKNGSKPLELEPGTRRCWLEDGDTITLQAWCQNGTARLGFGSCTTVILPEKHNPSLPL